MRLLDTKRCVKASRVVWSEKINTASQLFFFEKKRKRKENKESTEGSGTSAVAHSDRFPRESGGSSGTAGQCQMDRQTPDCLTSCRRGGPLVAQHFDNFYYQRLRD